VIVVAGGANRRRAALAAGRRDGSVQRVAAGRGPGLVGWQQVADAALTIEAAIALSGAARVKPKAASRVSQT